MSLRLFTSNRLEILSDALVQALSVPLPSPFEKEIIIVQSKGMERWVSIELAKKMGICSNIRFPFPNKFIYEMFQTVFPDLPQKSIFDREFMTWRIMKLLPAILEKPQFDILKQYLAGPRTEIKKIQLSERIADLFDQYLLFRPEMIFSWESGKENHWQAALWRELIEGKGNLHRASIGRDFVNILDKKEVQSENLPARIALFGISALPKFHIQMLASLAKYAEVNLFLLNPCKEFWGDILSDSEIKSFEKNKPSGTIDLFHIEKGNTLLASLGKLGRDFFDLIEEWETEEFSQFQEPKVHTLLSAIQTDILQLEDRSLTWEPKSKIKSSDLSVQIHSCHSPRREMEILQDHLLQMFENDPSLKPGDILVITPDIEPYAPFIHSVFELSRDDPRRIPFNIADRSVSKENTIVKTFFAVLDLYNSRFTAPQVFAVLESPAVQKQFNISEDDLSRVHSWITETRIRWGKNVQNRSNLGLPEFDQNTWKAGLDRLLLGYALPGENRNFFADDLLPFDNVEGSSAVVLGNFLEFTEQLFENVESLGKNRTLREWSVVLSNLLETLFSVDDHSVADIQIIRRLLEEFKDYQEFSDFDLEIELEPIKHYLKTRLDREGYGYGFLTGGITFCSLLPMRSIPARVICLVGMNSNAYPRQSRQLGFDLLARSPQKGDRSRRNDDRYLFLEAILSARDKLHISYIGQSIKDNSSIPPSVLVSELQDYIDSNFTMEGFQINNRIKTNHRLQAFSPEYFKENEKLFSYSRDILEIAASLLEPKKEPLHFISEKLPEPDEKLKEVSLSDLYRFLRNPTRFLLTKRLNLFLRESPIAIEEKESFSLFGLDRYLVAQSLVNSDLTPGEIQQKKQSASSTGMLPLGAVGDYEYDRLSHRVRHFVAKTSEIVHGEALEPLEIDLELNGFRITGQLAHIHENGILIFRYAAVRAKDHLNAWLNHLVLNSCSPGEYPRTTYLTGVHTASDGQWLGWRFLPLPSSVEILNQLLEIYWTGLSYPIRFFPESSYVFSSLLKNGKKENEALENARKKWFGSDRERGEVLDVYFQLCFGKEENPLIEDFDTLSKTVFDPLLNNQEELL